VVVATLTEGFVRLLPVIAGVALAQIAAAAFLLTRRSHTAATVAVAAAVKVLSIAAAGIYLTVYPYVLAGPGLPAGAELGIEVVNKVIRAGCILGIVFGSVEVATLLVRYFRRPVPAAR
jgi:hypothetical protein